MDFLWKILRRIIFVNLFKSIFKRFFLCLVLIFFEKNKSLLCNCWFLGGVLTQLFSIINNGGGAASRLICGLCWQGQSATKTGAADSKWAGGQSWYNYERSDEWNVFIWILAMDRNYHWLGNTLLRMVFCSRVILL